MYVIGLMSGTSADGVDAALVDIRGTGHDLKITLQAFRTFPYPTAFRERLLQAMTGGTVEDVCHMNGALGEWFSRARRSCDTRPHERRAGGMVFPGGLEGP